MPMNAASMLAANGPQTPNGTSLDASAMLGLPGLGSDLKRDTEQQIEDRRRKMLEGDFSTPAQYGAATALFGGQ